MAEVGREKGSALDSAVPAQCQPTEAAECVAQRTAQPALQVEPGHSAPPCAPRPAACSEQRPAAEARLRGVEERSVPPTLKAAAALEALVERLPIAKVQLGQPMQRFVLVVEFSTCWLRGPRCPGSRWRHHQRGMSICGPNVWLVLSEPRRNRSLPAPRPS